MNHENNINDDLDLYTISEKTLINLMQHPFQKDPHTNNATPLNLLFNYLEPSFSEINEKSSALSLSDLFHQSQPDDLENILQHAPHPSATSQEENSFNKHQKETIDKEHLLAEGVSNPQIMDIPSSNQIISAIINEAKHKIDLN